MLSGNIRVLACMFLLLFTQACNLKVKTVEPKIITPVGSNSVYSEEDSWIYETMKQYYLWESDMVTKEKSDLSLDPEKYFYSILYKYDEVDRFSWIEKDAAALQASLAGVSKVAGISYARVDANESKTNVALSINYALKGSPAEKAGIKRGDLIVAINGTPLTKDNVSTLFASDNLTFTLGEFIKANDIKSTNKVISLTKQEIQTQAVQFSSIQEISGKKIGYLQYIRFLSDSDSKLRETFGEFKKAGINELVLDLRYNPGGAISSADILSSLIVKNLRPGTLMSKQVWNTAMTKDYKARYGNNVFDTNWRNEPNNLTTINRVYVLTSNGTASSSELVINHLKPFMDVILIGDNTVGKNVGSITLSDTKKRWGWGLQPIVLKTANALGQSEYGTKDGFTPNYKVADDVIPAKPFASMEEPLFAAAVNLILGKPVTPVALSKKSARVQVIDKQSHYDNPELERNEMFISEFPKK
ncbi:MAG: S41 family peptidase [Leadbetterella sp.]